MFAPLGFSKDEPSVVYVIDDILSIHKDYRGYYYRLATTFKWENVDLYKLLSSLNKNPYRFLKDETLSELVRFLIKESIIVPKLVNIYIDPMTGQTINDWYDL